MLSRFRDRLNTGRRTGRSLPDCLFTRAIRGRKVRTPQGSVPDNVRDVGLKTHGRPVPQKRYRLGYPSRVVRDRQGIPERPDRFAWTAGPRRGKGEMVR